MATSKISMGKLKVSEYSTDEAFTVPANGEISLNVGNYQSVGYIIAVMNANYDNSDMTKLIPYGSQWYDTSIIRVFNPSSSAITIPNNHIFRYLAIPY